MFVNITYSSKTKSSQNLGITCQSTLHKYHVHQPTLEVWISHLTFLRLHECVHFVLCDNQGGY